MVNFLHIALKTDQAVDIIPVSLVRRDPSRGGVRMGQVPQFLEIGHDVPDRGRTQPETIGLDQDRETDRGTCGDIAVYDSLQYFFISLFKFDKPPTTVVGGLSNLKREIK